MNTQEKDDSLTLSILEAIDERSDVTQRHLASDLGVALGLANSYLKRCVRKGLVKIHQAPANRYLYYLTPKGFSEKSRLTAEFLKDSLTFYRRAGESCTQALDYCQARGWNRIVLCGASELAEIATMRAVDHEVAVVAVFDPEAQAERFTGLPVVDDLTACPPFDAAVLTDLADPDTTLVTLRAALEGERIVVPSILGLRAVS